MTTVSLHKRSWLAARIGGAALAAGTVLLSGVALAAPAHAATCVGILAADGPANRDMGRGADNGPLANLNSADLRDQERWEVIQVGNFVVLRSNLHNADGGLAAAAVTSKASGTAVVSRPLNVNDTRQQWRRVNQAGKITYTNRFSGLEITRRSMDDPEFFNTPILQTIGVTGGNTWTEKSVACLG
ncbi:hypothetical protein [Acrocarpospora catenulata]|uniref:hypothetical protein n=1 Tax=Acrocarpospora catenulata TaxID=2836182 RepID=UPI001BDB1F51|nr:hypothetical protein [Acrocarpospora catenulata]